MIDSCDIRIAHQENPRSWRYVAYERKNFIEMEFCSHPHAIRAGRPLEINCEESGSAYEGAVQLRLTLPQAKKMKEFLDHFIKTEEAANG